MTREILCHALSEIIGDLGMQRVYAQRTAHARMLLFPVNMQKQSISNAVLCEGVQFNVFAKVKLASAFLFPASKPDFH